MILRTAQHRASRPGSPESPGTDSHEMRWGWRALHSSARWAKPNTSNRSSSAITVDDVSGSGGNRILEAWLSRAGACMARMEKPFPDLGICCFVQLVRSEKNPSKMELP